MRTVLWGFTAAGKTHPAFGRVAVQRAVLLAGVALLVFVLLAAAASGSPLPPVSDRQVMLHLRCATFDPLIGPPASGGEPVSPPQSGQHPYLVQFSGPIEEAWKQQIVALGGQPVDYIPDFAYIVLIDAQISGRLPALPNVRWAGYLQPAYRIDPALARGPDMVTVTVTLFPGANSTAFATALGRSGGRLTAVPDAQSHSVRAVLPSAALNTLAALPDVAWIEPYRPARLWNDVARGIMGVIPVWMSHGLRGGGQIIAIADTGLDNGRANSIGRDFRGRVVAAYAWGREDDWSDPDGHGTHVAGAAVGNGANSGSNPGQGDYSGSHAGIAPEAGLVIQSVLDEDDYLGGLPADLGTLFQQAYDAGARVHSNSWGVAVDDGGRVYDSQAQQVDRFMWEHPDMVILFAAGNDGADANRDGAVDLGSVTTPATAKNVLAIGASESVRLTGGYAVGGWCSTWGECWPDDFPVDPLNGDRLSNNPAGMAAFSSRGPTPDGRLKPDLVAPGTNILSVRSSVAPAGSYWGVYDEFYAYAGGTSMATPLAAGAAALVRQYYQTESHEPSAALVKATLLAGAVDMTPGQYPGHGDVPQAPNMAEGWGRLDLTSALFPIAPRRTRYIDASTGVVTGESHVYTYTVAASGAPLRVMLAWTDYPGSLAAAAHLVNDLDLQVNTAATSTVQTVVDRINNVEGVIIEDPAPGVYRISVRGRNVPFGPQPYALVVSGHLMEPAVTPQVRIGQLPGFAMAGSTITVTWAISGGTSVTATVLMWDTASHEQDHSYPNIITASTSSTRTFSAPLVIPFGGVVYLSARAWVDGQQYDAPVEHRINVVAAPRRLFLPVVFTYPAPEPTPTPPPTTTPAVAVQIIRNGGFEDAAPQSPPWRQFDRADPNGLLVADFWPRQGRWSAWLGGVYADYQQIYQTIAVPPGSSHASLVFHWFMNTEDDAAIAYDLLFVRLLNAAGDHLALLVERDNTSTRGVWVTTRYSWVGDFPYAGQTIRLSFEMLTNATRNTNLFVDDVSFFVSSGPIDGAQPGCVEYPGR